MLKHITIALILLLLLAACSTAPLRITDYTNPIVGSGFTLLPPKGHDWHLAYKSDDWVAIGTLPDKNHRTTGCFAMLVQHSDEVAEQDAMEAGLRYWHATTVYAEPRNIIVENEYKPRQEGDQICIDFKLLVRDTAAKTSDGVKSMFMSEHGYACMHPDNAKRAVVFTYSERYLRSNEPTGIEGRAKQCLDNTALAPL